MTRLTRVLGFVALLVQLPAQAVSLFTIGPDASLFPVPRALTALSISGVASPLATLPDGTLAYNGGLAFRPAGGGNPDTLYAVANDGLGQSTLYRLDPDGGNLTPVLSLGVGFTGGLAYDPGADALYAIQTELPFFSPPSASLYRIDNPGGTPTLNFLGALSGIYGGGAGGGLTYDANDGMLYAIAWDALGIPRTLSAIDPTAAIDTPLFDLGAGDLAFSGGLEYDAAGDFFYAISNDSFANSTLTTLTLAGAGTFAPVGASFGQGFMNTGLALAPTLSPPVPEPPALALALLGAGGWGVGRLAARGRGRCPVPET